MKRTLHHKHEFTDADIKKALLYWLKEECPDVTNIYPEHSITFQFKLSENGAEINWSESENTE